MLVRTQFFALMPTYFQLIFSLSYLQAVCWMAVPSTTAGSLSKKGPSKEKAEDADDDFSVGQFVERTEVLPADKLVIDRDLSHGQVRTVDEGHVRDLMEHYNVNEPDEIRVTVVKEQGMPRLCCCTCFWLACFLLCFGRGHLHHLEWRQMCNKLNCIRI